MNIVQQYPRIGSDKTEHLKKEHGDSLPFMLNIKGLVDPNGIMNPSKIFSERNDKCPKRLLKENLSESAKLGRTGCKDRRVHSSREEIKPAIC